MDVLQIDSNPEISSLVDQNKKLQTTAELPESEGSSSLLGKRNHPEPEDDEESIQAQPKAESAIQILSIEPPEAAQKEDQKKSVRFEEVEVNEADPFDPNKVVRRKLKIAKKEKEPAKGKSIVLGALAKPDLRV